MYWYWIFYVLVLKYGQGQLHNYINAGAPRVRVNYYQQTSFLTSGLLFRATRAAEHKVVYWGMQMIDGCNLKLCMATLSRASSGKSPH